ncbi:3'-5' exonuclease [Candidatus Azambacteria bacterium]|nr:3'-5' exonuclease [Candidatus Azambacteria bacterium]
MIIVDVETTGLDPYKHSIASIGAVDFGNPQNQFHEECRIWEGAEIEQEALRVNGFTEEQLRDPRKPTLTETMRHFTVWAKGVSGDITLAGENVFFDRDFLRASAERCGLEWIFSNRIVDLHSVSFAHHVKRGIAPPLRDKKTMLSLDKTLAYVGMPEEPKPHIAINGAKLEAEAFSRLLYGKPLFTEYEQYSVPEYLL